MEHLSNRSEAFVENIGPSSRCDFPLDSSEVFTHEPRMRIESHDIHIDFEDPERLRALCSRNLEKSMFSVSDVMSQYSRYQQKLQMNLDESQQILQEYKSCQRERKIKSKLQSATIDGVQQSFLDKSLATPQFEVNSNIPFNSQGPEVSLTSPTK